VPGRHGSSRSVRIVGALLASVWICAGVAAIVVGAGARRWLLVVLGLAAIWYGVIWADVARKGRRITTREALTPWRLGR
jgi:predicted phage tail protein